MWAAEMLVQQSQLEKHLTNPQPTLPKLELPVRARLKPMSSSRRWHLGLHADDVFKSLILLGALSLVAILVLIVVELIQNSRLTLAKFGWRFFVSDVWDPVAGQFGAWAFVYGTLVSSLIALLLAVPLGIAVAVFINELCPRSLRKSLSFAVELLAAIPSVIFGLWGIFVLAPLLRAYLEPFLAKYFGWTGLFSGPAYGIGMLAAGIILAIMIVPIICSISREVMLTVPQQQREGVLALGATQWEMIRIGVLRNARTGILGAIILGLGRALGETMAVTMVIGNSPDIARSLFAPGYTMASVIANELNEAMTSLHRSALIEIGLALFIVTLIVNAFARLLVWTSKRGMPARVHA